jgi:hypothetical protein
MPRVPAPVTSPPEVPGQPYDATSDAPCGKWVSVNPKSGPASFENPDATGEFPSADGWSQT